MATVLLVRHGRTTANASGTLAGWTPGVGLDDTGQAQAAALGRRVAAAGLTLARVVSSPLQRCVETAEAVVREAGGGIPVEVDERLGECRYGAWTGRPLAELAGEPLWRVVQAQPSAAVFPDGEQWPGESIAAMQARGVCAVRETDRAVTAENGEGAVWVAVSHGDVVKAILADAAGVHLDHFQRLVVDPGSVSVVRYTPARPFVLRVNDLGSPLDGLVAAAPEADAAVGGGAGAPDAPAGPAAGAG